jgi:hypothetical protein
MTGHQRTIFAWLIIGTAEQPASPDEGRGWVRPARAVTITEFPTRLCGRARRYRLTPLGWRRSGMAQTA